MLARQQGEHAAEFGPLAGQHRVGELRVEQQPPDPGVAGDGADQVGDARPVLLVAGCGRDGGLRRRGDVGDHPVEDRGDEGVLVGEALVEVPRGLPAVAQMARTVRSGGSVGAAEQFETRVEEPAPALRQPARRLDAAIGPDLRHAIDLDTRHGLGAISGNIRSSHFRIEGGR